jgi:hypothetical protein
MNDLALLDSCYRQADLMWACYFACYAKTTVYPTDIEYMNTAVRDGIVFG